MAKLKLKPEQEQAILHDNGNIIVSASAGSGKTFVMIQRLTRLIKEGKADADQILCVTFTEAAAADMKAKLKASLIEETEKGNDRAAEQLVKLSTADIGTLHSFCSKLIRTYFFIAGVSPDYKIADESEADAIKEESLDKTFREFYKEKNAGFYKLIDCYRSKRRNGAIRDIVKSLYSSSCTDIGSENIISSYKKWYTEDGKREVENFFIEKIAIFSQEISAEAQKLKSIFEEAGFTYGVIACQSDIDLILELIKNGPAFAKTLNPKTSVMKLSNHKPKERGAEFKALYDGLAKKIEDLIKFCTDGYIEDEWLNSLYSNGEALYGIVKRFEENYAKAKKEANLLDFNDLEKFSIVILKDEDIRNAVKSKYKFVFVDEYQDINNIQEAIISLITDNNLFMVGDAKQSIYGFRGCRPEIFEERERTMEQRGETAVRLDYSFRSAKNVIKTVNEIFDFCYTKKFGGTDYKNVARLKEGGIYPDNAEGRAELHLLIKEKKQRAKQEIDGIYDLLTAAHNVSEKESAAVSGLLAEIINRELSNTYYDTKSGEFKPVTMNDIAILARTGGDSNYVRGIVEGLAERGIRVISDVKQNACDFPEIGVLINALKLIDNFRQDVPLATAMLSVIGKFSEEDLMDVAAFSTGNGKKPTFCESFFNYIEGNNDDLSLRLKKFKEYIELLRFTSVFKGAKGVLEKISFDCGYENFLLANSDADAKIRRYYKFLSETVVGDRRLTVAEFLDRVENRRKTFECSEGGEEDAVKIITMHSSKGLEYPVVIVCGLERKFSTIGETESVITDKDNGVFAKYFDEKERVYKDTAFRRMCVYKMRETQLKEEMRLFYVATTRASYSLHLIMEGSGDSRGDVFKPKFFNVGNYIQFIPNTIPLTVHEKNGNGLADITESRKQVIIVKSDKEREFEMRKNFAFVYPYQSSTVLPIKNNVTAVVASKKEEYYPVNQISVNEETASGKFLSNGIINADDLSKGNNLTDTESGIVAHKVMENLDFTRPFDGQTEEMIQRGIITLEELSLIDEKRLKKAVESGAFDDVKGKTLLREKDFIVNVPANLVFDTDSQEKVLLQGIIDLLIVDENGVRIIDYKYSRRSPENLKKTYKVQLDLYAYAVENALKIKVLSKTLVNVYSGETVNV